MVFCVLTHTHQKQTFPIMMQETWPSLAKKYHVEITMLKNEYKRLTFRKFIWNDFVLDTLIRLHVQQFISPSQLVE